MISKIGRIAAAAMTVLCASTALSTTAFAAPAPDVSGLPPMSQPPANKGPEAGTEIASPLAYKPAGSKPGGGATTMAGPTAGTYYCNAPWVFVANYPSGYVTGNCKQGTQWLGNRTSDADGHQYIGGYVGSTFAGCGWLRANNLGLIDGTYNPACSTTSQPNCDFMYCVNGSPYIWTDETGRDGIPVSIKSTGCLFFQNYRPWASGQTPTDYIRTIAGDGNTTTKELAIRYMARYQYGGIYWIMAHAYDGYPSGQGNWGFIPQNCL